MFYRVYGRKDYEGTGLGLAICKKIIENHKGFIFAEGKENEGAAFHIYLPVEERHKLVHPDDIPGMQKYAASIALLSDKDVAIYEYRVKSKLKDWIWLRI